MTAAKDDTDKVEITAPDLEKDPSDNTWTVRIFDKNNDGTKNGEIDLSVIADGKYATIAITGDKGNVGTISGTTLKNVAAGNKYTVTVTTECAGQCSNKTWTIEVTGWDYISGAVDKIAYGGLATELKADITAYYDYGTAVAKAQELSIASYDWIRVYGDNALVVTNDDDNYPATYKSFTTSAQAAACTTFDTDADALANNMDGTLSYQLIDVSLMENKQVIVIGFTPQGEGGETVYTAFVVEK